MTPIYDLGQLLYMVIHLIISNQIAKSSAYLLQLKICLQSLAAILLKKTTTTTTAADRELIVYWVSGPFQCKRSL